MKLAVLFSLLAGASAFAPQSSSNSKTQATATKADLEELAGKLNPIVKYYDPLNLAEADFYEMGNEATIGFL
eukprot:CAMPEP_0116868152 /NCGR_PEP_ID=MMETSP0418-20121206/27023_1 /TAXON_ID=1158023 /ORGANISM="Astrosyne radiata, Strain 13vi08-1A" /LENGTH=71 /DNA_ID=CAMNT_0004504061 /DNA_START=684 /DNA_END=895 /DNA_ORIENTATION=+